jgi:tetratricopeptide (TPR) repeat protein
MTGSTPETLLAEGYQARREHRLADAEAHFAKAVDLCRKAGDRALLAQALTDSGRIERDLHRADAALKHYGDAADLYRSLDAPLLLAHTIRHLADILQDQRKLDLAARHYKEALEIYRSHDETPPLDLANALRGLALLKGETGDMEGAKNLWQEARGLYAAGDVQAGVAESDARIARLMER